MELIRTTIAPATWQEQGGKATLQYFPVGLALVINQTAAVHDKIQELLTALRRLQELEVAVEVRIVRVSDVVLEQIGQKLDTNNRQPPWSSEIQLFQFRDDRGQSYGYQQRTLLSEIQLSQFLEAVQGDQAATITQLPKMTLFNGQRAAIDVTNQESVVTDLIFSEKNGKFSLAYKEQIVTTGIEAKVRPVVSADRTEVNLSLDLSLSEPAPNFSWDLVSSTEHSSRCKKQVTNIHRFGRFAEVKAQNLQTVLKIPDGQTAVLVVGKESVSGGTCSVLVLVTPRIIVNEEEEQEVFDHGTLPPMPRR